MAKLEHKNSHSHGRNIRRFPVFRNLAHISAMVRHHVRATEKAAIQLDVVQEGLLAISRIAVSKRSQMQMEFRTTKIGQDLQSYCIFTEREI
ncbi:hypothetical protein BC936DRAFT_147888 [Jimgerdemannia flammicorona]|uniref:Uncharacterized protein n=1 Tax=Jimgerdemannia flammicorona TaxID=994334 RepID=A0A433D4A8_9FUNG|nr:hypothetical protein BC936DRAFT_147888 [Jimgerdemannia flammicorona]